MTSTVEIKDDSRGRPIQKAKVSPAVQRLLICLIFSKWKKIWFGTLKVFQKLTIKSEH